MDNLFDYLDHIAYDASKCARVTELHKEEVQLEKETGVQSQIKIGTEWSSNWEDLALNDAIVGLLEIEGIPIIDDTG